MFFYRRPAKALEVYTPKRGAIFGAALTALSIGVGAYQFKELGIEARESRAEVEAEIQSEIGTYLAYAPELEAMLQQDRQAAEETLANIQSTLGANCIAAMQGTWRPNNFEEAITGDGCTDFTADQLQDAKPFYDSAVLSLAALDQHIARLHDDPASAADNIDTLRSFIDDDTPEHMPDMAEIVAVESSLDDSRTYSVVEISRPELPAGMPKLPWSALFASLAGIALTVVETSRWRKGPIGPRFKRYREQQKVRQDMLKSFQVLTDKNQFDREYAALVDQDRED